MCGIGAFMQQHISIRKYIYHQIDTKGKGLLKKTYAEKCILVCKRLNSIIIVIEFYCELKSL